MVARYPTGTLTIQQVSFFRQAGYLRLIDRLDAELVTQAAGAIQAEVTRRRPPFQTDQADRIHRLDALYQRGEVFQQVFAAPLLLDALESLLGPNIEFILNRHNHGTINYQGTTTFRLHRDILQWSRSVVTAIVYLEDATLENGCTWLIPTSQYLPFAERPNNGGTWMDEHAIYEDLIGQALPCPMGRGQVLLLDSLAFHTVGDNATDRTRMSIAGAYHSVDELDGAQSHSKRVVVRGARIYRGNDGERR